MARCAFWLWLRRQNRILMSWTFGGRKWFMQYRRLVKRVCIVVIVAVGIVVAMLSPLQRTLDEWLHRPLHFLAPKVARSPVLHMTFVDSLTDAQRKARLLDNLPALYETPPRALVLAGDWSHRSPVNWNAPGQPRPVDSAIVTALAKLSSVTSIWIPAYPARQPWVSGTPWIIPLHEAAFPTWPTTWWLWRQIVPQTELVSWVRSDWQEVAAGGAPVTIDGGAGFVEVSDRLVLTLPMHLAGVAEVRLDEWHGWRLNGLSYPIGANGQFFRRTPTSMMSSTSFAELGSQNPVLWKDTIVFVAPLGDRYSQLAALDTLALLTGAYDWRPAWAIWGWLVLSMIFVSLLLWLDKRFSRGTSVLVHSFAVFALLSADYALAALHHWWLGFSGLAVWWSAVWVLYQLAYAAQRRKEGLYRMRDEAQQKLAEVAREKGEFDAAFAHLKDCRWSVYVADLLAALAADMESRRAYASALRVYQYMSEQSGEWAKRLSGRVSRLKQAMEVVSGERPASGAQTLILSAKDIHPPKLGRYTIERVLGQGAMGTVYLGSDPKIGRRVAIKTLNLASEFLEEDLQEARARFQREAETAGRLRHPNIVTIYDVGEEGDLSYIAMDYLSGSPLSEFIEEDKRLPPSHVFSLLAQAADGLAYAHEQGIVHRDIKPANLIYDATNERLVITDFGIARLTDESRTKTGTIVGSPNYMSPEQIEGRDVDGRSDIFSLGVTLYQLLSGQLPFQGDSLAAVAYAIVKQEPEDISRLVNGLPRGTSTMLKRALAKKPEKRFPSADLMAEALRKLAAAGR